MAPTPAVYTAEETLYAMLHAMRAERDAALERAALAEARLKRERDLSADLEEQLADTAERLDAAVADLMHARACYARDTK